MTDRLTFRPTAPDRAHIAAIASRLQADKRSVFVSRSDVVRTALRIAAEAVSADRAAAPAQDG